MYAMTEIYLSYIARRCLAAREQLLLVEEQDR